jgi:exonuclease VII large subunit
MSDNPEQLTIQGLYTKVNYLLNNNLDAFKGLVIVGVSIDKELRENTSYQHMFCAGTSAITNGSKESKYNINLKIPNFTITQLKKDNPAGGSCGTKYDICIGNIEISALGQITVSAAWVKENGLSDRELMNRRLFKYCTDKGHFNRSKRDLPRLVTSVYAITSDSSTIADDILSNLNMPERKVRIIRCRTSEEIASHIKTNTFADITVLYRGGREDEHMNMFSSESIIEAITSSSVPVCIALGHEIDRPFIYNIGDQEYSTPSAFAKTIAQINQDTKNDMKQSFARLTMRFSEIGNTIRDSIKASSERVEYMCQKIHASQINTVELAQQRISGISRAIREKISGSIELKKKKIDAIFHNILHIKKNLIDEQHNRIEQLATSIINSVTTQELHYKAADEKRNLVYVFIVIIITLLVAFWYFSRKN